MNICIFCGSSIGLDQVYVEAAKETARAMISIDASLVYGGGNIGLMGIVADEFIGAERKVIGVIPDFLLQRELGHQEITELLVVKSMHDRKKRMADLSDGFIALPGGWGTLEELAEILTWRQLGLIDKPIGVLNCNGFFDPLVTQMTRMVQDGFLQKDVFELLKIEKYPKELLASMGF
ncbi:MAG: TIGR00730 family Rossman fold protein [Cyclobacteriaceae bacterium]